MNVWNSALLLCLLFGVVYSHSCPDSSGNQTNSVDRHTTDPRWRLLSGLEATAIYSLYARFREMADPPLVNTTDYQSTQDDTSTDQGLESLIDAVCKLVSFHELVSSTDSGSTLHAVLSANVEDSCNWLHYLVSSRLHVSGSEEYQALTSSCSAGDTTRLHHYCMERQIRGGKLKELVHGMLTDSLHTYYSGRIPATNPRDWLHSTSMPADQLSRILDIVP